MEQYDPDRAPDPVAWNALSEGERLDLIREAHERLNEELPNLRAHACIHVVVENQVASEDAIARETLDRLIKEGLERHEAVHAVGAVLAEDIFELLRGNAQTHDLDKYHRRLNNLSAKRWKKGKW